MKNTLFGFLVAVVAFSTLIGCGGDAAKSTGDSNKTKMSPEEMKNTYKGTKLKGISTGG